MTTQLLRYAINSSNELVSIEDVPNGISCQCFCPKCKEPLVAKNAGIKKEHHFAHCSGSDCPGATMTALHLLAQKAFQQTKKITISAIAMMSKMLTVETLFSIVFSYLVDLFSYNLPLLLVYQCLAMTSTASTNGQKRCPDYSRCISIFRSM